jgi:uncharacterized protein (TIGR02147 family)
VALKAKPPNIFAAHDYRLFLKDWIAFLESDRDGFSMRSLARLAKVSVGYLPMVLAGHRSLSKTMLDRIAPHLGLKANELVQLENLREVAEAASHQSKAVALEKLQNSKSYRALNPQEFATYRYLSHWYIVAIRELATLEGFKLEAKWIQERLREKVPLAEIENAIQFLSLNGFIRSENGRTALEDKNIQCMGGVFKLALGSFHKQMLALASDAIDSVPSDERYLLGHTLVISADDLPKVKKILDDTLKKIEKLKNRDQRISSAETGLIFHIELTAIPLTRPAIVTDLRDHEKKDER